MIKIKQLLAIIELRFELGSQEFALWSRGRVDGSQSEGPRFDPCVSQKLFTKYYMEVVGLPHNTIEYQTKLCRVEYSNKSSSSSSSNT